MVDQNTFTVEEHTLQHGCVNARPHDLSRIFGLCLLLLSSFTLHRTRYIAQAAPVKVSIRQTRLIPDRTLTTMVAWSSLRKHHSCSALEPCSYCFSLLIWLIISWPAPLAPGLFSQFYALLTLGPTSRLAFLGREPNKRVLLFHHSTGMC